MIRTVVLLLALAVAQPALAQTAPTPTPNPHQAFARQAAAKKPAPPKPDAGAPRRRHRRPAWPLYRRHSPHRRPLHGADDRSHGVWQRFEGGAHESWGLDDLIVARVRAAAGAGVAVRRIAYPANAFEPFDHPPNRLFRNAEKDLKNVVQAIASAGGCERYVVVLKDTNADSMTNQSFTGIGIYSRAGGDVHLFALTALSVFDGHTFEVLKGGVGAPVEQKLGSNPTLYDRLRTNPMHGANVPLNDFSWPPAPDAVMGLREPTRALLAESLDKTLPKLLAPKSADEE